MSQSSLELHLGNLCNHLEAHAMTVRELPIKKMQLNYGILPKRSDPAPPRLVELLGHFFVGWFFFGTFGALFWSYFTKIRVKSAQKFLDLVHPPPFFSAQKSKMVGAQKVSQNFWIALDLPFPLMKEVHN